MKKKAYLKLIFAMIIWGTLGPLVKQIHLASSEIVLARCILGIVTLMIIYFISGGYRQSRIADKKAARRDMMILFISGAVMGFNWVFLFEAYKYTTVSMATVSYYCAPVIIIAASPVVLGEKLTVNRIAGIISAVAGMFMITGSLSGGSEPLRGLAFGLLAALFYAGVTLLNKQLKAGFTGIQITMIQLCAAGVVVAPYAIINHEGPWIMPQGTGLLCLLIVGVVHTGLVLHFYFSSMQVLPGQSVAMCSYIDPVSSLLIAAIILGERMSMIQCIGALLILGGAAFGEIYGKKEKKNQDK